MAANRIAYYRKKKRLSQRDLAKMLKVSPSYVSFIENRKTIPNEDFMDKLANILDVSIDELKKPIDIKDELVETLIKLTESGEIKWHNFDSSIAALMLNDFPGAFQEAYKSRSRLSATYILTVEASDSVEIYSLYTNDFLVVASDSSGRIYELYERVAGSSVDNSITMDLLEDAQRLLGDNGNK